MIYGLKAQLLGDLWGFISVKSNLWIFVISQNDVSTYDMNSSDGYLIEGTCLLGYIF